VHTTDSASYAGAWAWHGAEKVKVLWLRL